VHICNTMGWVIDTQEALHSRLKIGCVFYSAGYREGMIDST
jgi:hypothetical protein